MTKRFFYLFYSFIFFLPIFFLPVAVHAACSQYQCSDGGSCYNCGGQINFLGALCSSPSSDNCATICNGLSGGASWNYSTHYCTCPTNYIMCMGDSQCGSVTGCVCDLYAQSGCDSWSNDVCKVFTQTVNTASCTMNTKVYSGYKCQKGYYGNPTSQAAGQCQRCPSMTDTGGTVRYGDTAGVMVGNVGICFLSNTYTFQDAGGIFKFQNACYAS